MPPNTRWCAPQSCRPLTGGAEAEYPREEGGKSQSVPCPLIGEVPLEIARRENRSFGERFVLGTTCPRK